MNNNLQTTDLNREYRNFGILIGAVFMAIAFWPLLYSLSIRLWLAIPAAVIFTAAFLFPAILKHPFRIWMKFGAALGWLNTRIILTLLYFLAILPIAIILKITGKTPLKLWFEPDSASYREKPEDSADNEFDQQF